MPAATATKTPPIPATAAALYGKRLRFTFTDKASAGAVYDHTFNQDGSVDFGGVKDGKAGKPTHVAKSAIAKVANGIFLASYLGDSGYTLTLALNFNTGKITSFASNEKEWTQQTGTVEFV